MKTSSALSDIFNNLMLDFYQGSWNLDLSSQWFCKLHHITSLFIADSGTDESVDVDCRYFA